MATKVSVSEFLEFFMPHAIRTTSQSAIPPPAGQWGYSMGGTGEMATEAVLKQQARDYQGNNWEAYYNRSKRWLGRRIWDCNGMAEGYYKEKTGISINTQAKYNYSGWCGKKSPNAPDSTLKGMPQMPGVAIFSGDSAAAISHVGFLLEKTGPGDLDWNVIEAKGANYGVVITPLKNTNWRWWGVMDKYFDYGDGAVVPDPEPNTEPYYAICSGADGVYVRSGPGTGHAALGVLYEGDRMLAQPAVDGWCAVSCVVRGQMAAGYMSGKYVKGV